MKSLIYSAHILVWEDNMSPNVHLFRIIVAVCGLPHDTSRPHVESRIVRRKWSRPRLGDQPFFVEFGFNSLSAPAGLYHCCSYCNCGKASGTAAWAGVLALPWPIGMILADPAAILADEAFHGLVSSGLLPRIFLPFDSGYAPGSIQRFGQARPCRPEIVARRAASYPSRNLAEHPRAWCRKPDILKPNSSR
jgi:hypothetical protein